MHPATPPVTRIRDRKFDLDSNLPAWPTKPTRGYHLIHLLLAVLIAAALAWVVFGTAAAAFPYSPWSITTTQSASVGHIQRFRQRTIPGQPAPPQSCRRQPIDPIHQHFAMTGSGRRGR